MKRRESYGVMSIATPPHKPRTNPEVYHEQSLSPLADLHFDMVVLQSEFVAEQARLAEQMALNAKLQARLNRLSGSLTEFTQRVELADKRAKRKAAALARDSDSSGDSRD